MPVSTECAAALLSFRYPSLSMFVTGETYDISIIHGIVTLSLRPYDPAGMKRMSE